jgi:hypothetical protein
MSTQLKAKRVSNYVVQKEGPSKGKTYFVYNITGPADEIKKFINSPNQKLYPRKCKVTGTPQLHTMYIDPLKKENPLYLKDDGNYTLDQSETREKFGVLNALKDQAPELVSGYTAVLIQEAFGSGQASTTQLSGFAQPAITTPASDGSGSDLGDVE